MGGRTGQPRRGEGPRPFPKHLHEDGPEAWRAVKRAEFQEVLAALDRYNYGAAFTPRQRGLYEIQRELGRIQEALAQDGWVCW